MCLPSGLMVVKTIATQDLWDNLVMVTLGPLMRSGMAFLLDSAESGMTSTVSNGKWRLLVLLLIIMRICGKALGLVDEINRRDSCLSYFFSSQGDVSPGTMRMPQYFCDWWVQKFEPLVKKT